MAWLVADMPGASKMTRPVKTLNANWTAGAEGADGQFAVQLITDDEERHALYPSPQAMTALLALARAENVLLWDPADRTLIVANFVGKMPWTEGMDSAQAG